MYTYYTYLVNCATTTVVLLQGYSTSRITRHIINIYPINTVRATHTVYGITYTDTRKLLTQR